MKWLDFLICMHSIMMILWGDLKSWNEETSILVLLAMSAMQSMSALHGCLWTTHFMLPCNQLYVEWFSPILVGSEARLSRLVRLHRFCSQVGQVLIMTYYVALNSALVESLPTSHSCWAQSQMWLIRAGSAFAMHPVLICAGLMLQKCTSLSL